MDAREQKRYWLYLEHPDDLLYFNNGDVSNRNGSFLPGTVEPGGSELTNGEQTQLLLYDIFIPLLGSLIILLNLAVVVSSCILLRKGQQPYTTYLFLGNVAASDLLTGFAVIYGQYAPRELRSEDNCAILIGLIVSTTLVSVYSVGLIAVDRYLYIMNGIHYQRYITPTRARLAIGGTWFIGLIIGFLPAFGWRGDTDGGRICWFIRLAPPPLVILTTVVGILPVIVVIVLYSIILHKALRRVAQLKKASREQQGATAAGNLRLFRGAGTASNPHLADSPEQPLAEPKQTTKCFRCCCKKKSPTSPTDTPSTRGPGSSSGRHPTKWKAVKVVMLTTGCFVVTWMPYFIASTMFVLCDPNTNPDLCRGLQFAIASPLAILGFANSLLNPCIYAWWHQGFRTSIQKMCRKMCRCCDRRKDNKSTGRQGRGIVATCSDASSADSGQQVRASEITSTTTTSTVAEECHRTSSNSNYSGSRINSGRRNGNKTRRITYGAASDQTATDTDTDHRTNVRL
ncbi:glucose-dependent insulinotropic receptor-like [Uranotaenia lowii]|uniref:glucose-dependent insulinotropic receptor-like n=1 Tax=Uranotaenia lowii TaxID=190385 RepID=UPI00247A36F0|nr:glucose-dependent insulinotropic receptor-like [Uranotaenia lowii]XP_055602000.1 glucose-dependent insulinotropic receptor-like [Uranotaenia lowii]XP_055602768.1 glucose-dependent insulinotropic receptor-like [Uranotaenia lowii]XP_055603533.1 glucose-dependent insulinotropic receptor-like [Uranotaenia lowii]XP_055604136.1 glucose-dependent insulinotropic receptor-like [Uranotaenia lowii]XP_055604655.1 glucose-dependent insulinotropic receptor-like [Uranotaenia lowii]XP_055605198.1 glucose-